MMDFIEWVDGSGRRVMRSSHMAVNALVDLRSDRSLRDSEIEIGLESNPQIGRDTKILGQPKRGIGRDGTLAVDNGADAAWRDGNSPSEPVDAEAQRFHELFQQNLAGMNRVKQFVSRHRHTSVVINDFDLVGITMPPDEANPPFVIDANAMLPVAVAFQCFQPVSRRHLEILQRSRAMKVDQLPSRDSLNASIPRDVLIGEQGFGVAGSKRSNHAPPVYYV
jgi:hypothetical protein